MEKRNAREIILNTLILDHHPKPGMSIRSLVNTWRQEIGKIMLSVQEKMMHQTLMVFSSNRLSIPGEKAFEPWLTHPNRTL